MLVLDVCDSPRGLLSYRFPVEVLLSSSYDDASCGSIDAPAVSRRVGKVGVYGFD